MNSAAAETLIIGYGNPLRSDDAVGLHVAAALSAAGYRTIEIFQLAPELAEDIAASRRVIFVDCHMDLQPGEVKAGSVDPTLHPDTHLQTPGDLLRLAAELYDARPEAFLIGIGPESVDLGETLSQPVMRAIPRAVELARSLVL